MVSRAFRNCLELIEKMVKHNLVGSVKLNKPGEFAFINQIGKSELENLITRYIGADQRTIEKYTRVCVRHELLTPHITKNGEVKVYLVNLARVDHEFRMVFGRPLKQVTLPQAES
jgi:hypothetical protein